MFSSESHLGKYSNVLEFYGSLELAFETEAMKLNIKFMVLVSSEFNALIHHIPWPQIHYRIKILK